jgi:hypothetical protein
MARGSSDSGGGSGTPSALVVEMVGESGELNHAGKVRIRKKYFVKEASDLIKVKELPGYRATQVTYNKLDVGYEQNVDYAAQLTNSQAPGIVEKLGGLDGAFEMFTSYESHPIELHPRIDQLSVDFGGYFTPDGFAKWPPFYNPGGSGALSGGGQKRNPMFGVTRYKDVSMTFRHTYYVTNVARSIYDKAGNVVTTLPAGFPTPKGPSDRDGQEIKRRWLMQMPAISREGNSYRVVQDYVLLDTSGIASGLYETTSTPGQV